MATLGAIGITHCRQAQISLLERALCGAADRREKERALALVGQAEEERLQGWGERGRDTGPQASCSRGLRGVG